MATHDYNIANDTAANVRADINDVLAAIVSNNASGSEPATTFANMWWYDTANNLLKIRNETDTAWITVGTVNQVDGEFEPSNAINGTAGTDGNLAQWNGDGDLVDGPDVLDEDDFASDSDTAVPTQQSVKAYLSGIANSTPVDVSGTSSAGTSYPALDGPIMVYFGAGTDSGNLVEISPDNSTWHRVGRAASSAIIQNAFIVPHLWYYRIQSGGNINSSINYWLEVPLWA